MITINPTSQDVITINISDADQIQLNTTAILLKDRDVDTLDGEDGAYYLSRGNHTGAQAISTVTGLQDALDDKLESVAWGDITGTLSDQTDLQDALDTLTDADIDLQAQINLKLDSADYNDRFLGLYASVFDLEAAYPTANAGDYAQVDWGIGVDVIVYAWDVSDAQWSAVGSGAIANTDALPEGSSNLYLTGQRVRDTPLTGLSVATATPITSADTVLSAAGKLQAQISATAAKADAALAAIDAFNPANLSDAGTLLPNDQLVIWRDGVMLRTTVAAFGGGGDGGESTSLLLGSTGADESADGEFQRFAYDGASTMIGSPSYVAELDPSDWQPNPTIKFKLPSLTQAGQSVALYLFNGDVADLSGETFTVNNLIITADLNGDAGAYQLTVDHLSGRAGIDTTAIDPVPAAGTEITISIISRSSMLISFGSENIPVTLPTDFLATTLNIVLMSRASDTAVPPLSIQVTGVEVA